MPDSGPRVSTGMSSSGQAYRSAEYVRPPNEGVVVDLSKYADALINYEDISSRLTDDEERRIVETFRSEFAAVRGQVMSWKKILPKSTPITFQLRNTTFGSGASTAA